MTKPAAMAASTALPPLASMRAPASAARSCLATTTPPSLATSVLSIYQRDISNLESAMLLPLAPCPLAAYRPSCHTHPGPLRCVHATPGERWEEEPRPAARLTAEPEAASLGASHDRA